MPHGISRAFRKEGPFFVAILVALSENSITFVRIFFIGEDNTKNNKIMRKLFYLLLALPLVVAAVSCENGSDENNAKPAITITSGNVVEFSGEGGEAEILFTL